MKKICVLLFLLLAWGVGVGCATDVYLGQVHDAAREYAAYLRTESVHGTGAVRKGDPIVVLIYRYQVVLAPTAATLESLRDQQSDDAIAYKVANYKMIAYVNIVDKSTKPETHLYLVSRELVGKDGSCLYKETNVDNVPITVCQGMDPVEAKALVWVYKYMQAHPELIKDIPK